MQKLLALIASEPVRLVAGVQATLAAAVLFGLDLSGEQLGAIVVAISAWLAFFTRAQVTPAAEATYGGLTAAEWAELAAMQDQAGSTYGGLTAEEWQALADIVAADS